MDNYKDSRCTTGVPAVECKSCSETYSQDTGPVCPHCGYDHSKRELVDEIEEFNGKFDYGEYSEHHHFWLSMLEHQVREAWESYTLRDDEHSLEEAADTVLVAFQFMSACGDEPPEHYIKKRMENAEEEGIEEEIVSKYLDWYEDRKSLRI